jgi:hypothetical protein
MVSLDYSMETNLDKPQSGSDDLLTVAAYYARDSQAACADVSAMVFPSGHVTPSEEMLAVVAHKMRGLILGIENTIIAQPLNGPITDPVSWKILSKSGFLRDAPVVDFILARFSEDRLNARIANHGEVPLMDQLPARLLSSGNSEIADAAQIILLSEAMQKRSAQSLHRLLTPELLHQLVWRVVASLQIHYGEKNVEQVHAAKAFLTAYDEAQSGRVAARKLIHLVGNSLDEEALDPQKAGLAIFIAALSSHTQLDQDHILRLIDGHSSTPLAILLKLCGLERDAAMAVICLFKGFSLTPLEVNIFENHYSVLSHIDAQKAVDFWAQERLNYLAFSNTAQIGVQ